MIQRNKVFNHIDISGVYKPVEYTTTEENGRVYFLKDRQHGYYSITTVLSNIGKEKITKWKKRIGEVEAEKISSYAKDRGNCLHEMTERYLKNEDRNFINQYNSLERMRFSQIRPYLNKHIDNILLQENVVYSDVLKVSGRCDLIAEWDGILSIIDFKGSNKLKKVEWISHYFLQETFYSLAFFEMTKYKVKQIVTLIVGDDLSVKPYMEKVTSDKIQNLKNEIKEWYFLNGIPTI